MSLTDAEEIRLQKAEEAINELFVLLKGAGSKNMLNRLYVLFQNDLKKINSRVDTLETEVTNATELVRKLQ